MTDKREAGLAALHGAIMNLPCKRTLSQCATTHEARAYAEGHRDARHAAAELVNEFAGKSPDWQVYYSALSQCAELLDNMQDGDAITDTPKFLAVKLEQLHMAGAAKGGITSLEGLTRYEAGYKGMLRNNISGEYVEFGEVKRLFAAPSSTEASAQAAPADVRNQALEEAAKVADSNYYGPCGEYDFSYGDAESKADDRAQQISQEIRALRTTSTQPTQPTDEKGDSDD